MQEKRRFKRVPLQVKAHFRCKGMSESNLITRDLSVKGAFLKSKLRPPLGATCEIKLMLTEGDKVLEQVSVKAEVVRKEEDGFAVEFKEIPLADFIILKRIVSLNLSDDNITT